MPSYQTRFHIWPKPPSGTYDLVWQELSILDGVEKSIPRRRSLRTKDKKKAEKMLERALRSDAELRPQAEQLTLHEAQIPFCAIGDVAFAVSSLRPCAPTAHS